MPSDPMIASLEEQVGCYKRLAKLAEQQHQHVQQGQTEALLEVLGKRQEMLDQIARIETDLAPVKHNWAASLADLTPANRAQAEQLLGQTRLLLEQITTADRNDSLVLQQRKQTLGVRINQAQAAKSINRTYAAAAYGTPKPGMDLKR
jgi:septal ring factor EnvC (AmiA/AmiB activator)